MGITHPSDRGDEREQLKDWFRRGIAHVLGSDGHSLNRRPPDLARRLRAGPRLGRAAVADRVGSINGMAVLQGLPLRARAESSRARTPLVLPSSGDRQKCRVAATDFTASRSEPAVIFTSRLT